MVFGSRTHFPVLVIGLGISKMLVQRIQLEKQSDCVLVKSALPSTFPVTCRDTRKCKGTVLVHFLMTQLLKMVKLDSASVHCAYDLALGLVALEQSMCLLNLLHLENFLNNDLESSVDESR